MGMNYLAKEMGIDPEKYEQQCKMEIKGFNLGEANYKTQVAKMQASEEKDSLAALVPEKRMLQRNIHLLTEELTQRLRRSKKDESGYPRAARLFFLEADPRLDEERLAYLVLRYALNIPPDDCRVQSACVKLGKQIENDYQYLMFQTNAPAYLSVVEANLKSAHLVHRHKVLRHSANKVNIYDEDEKLIGTGIKSLDWNDFMQFAVGKLLLEALTTSTVLFELASRKTKKRVSSSRLGYLNVSHLLIRRTPTLVDYLEKGHSCLAEEDFLVYPFLIPPKPWTGCEEGGFWSEYKGMSTRLIKTRVDWDKTKYRVKRHGIKHVNDALNAIQKTKFRINVPVYEVMKDCKDDGLGGLPNQDIPKPKSSPWDDDEIKNRIANKCPEWSTWKKEQTRAYDKWYRDTSKREMLISKLRIAKLFKDEPELYFTWNLDYRGRIYCLQPFINPQMDDSGKALLEFAEGKELGAEGLCHLCIHGANVFGFDKATLEERQDWVADHHYEIMDSADNPLDGNRFWCQADKPFNFLAFCFEYAGSFNEGDTFKSHLPVQQDGTCSGLQHYSALLKDDVGGNVVNLTPTEEKSDVYAEVAIVVNRILNKDLQEGGDKGKYAKMWLDVGVDRKICKRNVMTFCYGATRAGFTQQLISLDLKENLGLPIDSVMQACNYLGGVNWAAVAETLVKSVEAMKLLQKLAFFMAKRNYDIQWSNSVGLRVTQDYRKTKTKQMKTWWGGIKIYPSIVELTNQKDTVGSRNGIAPNYIHSLDASHLMLTAMKCAEEGVTSFSFIHDSFGTHAADMEAMSRILRETFIEMYSENLLDKFIEDVREQLYPEHQEDFDKLVNEFKPEMGSLDIDNVQSSLYFFS